jgi:hypothetical protein
MRQRKWKTLTAFPSNRRATNLQSRGPPILFSILTPDSGPAVRLLICEREACCGMESRVISLCSGTENLITTRAAQNRPLPKVDRPAIFVSSHRAEYLFDKCATPFHGARAPRSSVRSVDGRGCSFLFSAGTSMTNYELFDSHSGPIHCRFRRRIPGRIETYRPLWQTCDRRTGLSERR